MKALYDSSSWLTAANMARLLESRRYSASRALAKVGKVNLE